MGAGDVDERDEHAQEGGGEDGIEGKARACVDFGEVLGEGKAVLARESPEHARGGGDDGGRGEDVHCEYDGCLSWASVFASNWMSIMGDWFLLELCRLVRSPRRRCRCL